MTKSLTEELEQLHKRFSQGLGAYKPGEKVLNDEEKSILSGSLTREISEKELDELKAILTAFEEKERKEGKP